MSSDRSRWQYRVVNLGAFDALPRMVTALADLGSDGWELAATMDKASNWLRGVEKGFLLFKREVRPGEPEPEGGWAAAWTPPSPSGVTGWEQIAEGL